MWRAVNSIMAELVKAADKVDKESYAKSDPLNYLLPTPCPSPQTIEGSDDFGDISLFSGESSNSNVVVEEGEDESLP